MSGGMPWSLPETWQWGTFQDVAEIRSDLKDPRATPGAVHIAPNHIEAGTGRLLGRGSVAGDKVTSPKHAFQAGQVLYSKIRPYLAKAVLVDFEGLCSADMYPVSVRAGIMDPKFLHRWLLSPAFTDAASESQGRTVLPKINQAALNTKPVPIAPLAEQGRVSAKVEALLGRVYACRRRLESVPALLNRFRQSILVAATSGELTREWRDERATGGDTATWAVSTLADLCSQSRVITYGVIKLGTETPGGVPCLRTSNVRWLRVDTDGMKRISHSLSAEYGRTVLEGDEVLVNVRGTLGGVAVAEARMIGWNVSREVAVVPVNAQLVNPKFVAYWIASDDMQRQLSRMEKGVAYTGINIEDLRTLPVSIPPRQEQDAIVDRIEGLLRLADRLEARVRAGASLAMRLAPACLAKAFHGELVPQDPNDEPASVMLERLRAQRASNAGDPKSGRRRRSSAQPIAQRAPKRSGAKKRRAS